MASRADPEPRLQFDLARERFIELDDDDVRREDDDSASHGRRVFDADDERAERERLAAEIEALEAPTLAPPLRAKGNTGVKGVINDYLDHRQAVIDAAARKKQHILQQAQRWALSKPPASAAGAQQQTPDADADADAIDALAEELFGSDEEMFRELESEFFAEYKAKKLREMLAGLPSFGFYKEIDEAQFVDEIDDEHPAALVVIHLFDDSVPDCKWVDHALAELAGRHVFVKFRRIRAALANAKLDRDVLPALLVYKNKDLLHSLFVVGQQARATSAASPSRLSRMTPALVLESYLISLAILTKQD